MPATHLPLDLSVSPTQVGGSMSLAQGRGRLCREAFSVAGLDLSAAYEWEAFRMRQRFDGKVDVQLRPVKVMLGR